MGKYKDYVNLTYISAYQELSERFIEKYKGRLDWCLVSQCQRLSSKFVSKYIDKITEDIFDNPYYKTSSDSVKLSLKQKFNK